MHEWHTQASISYELRHVSLPLQANGSACIRHALPCPNSGLLNKTTPSTIRECSGRLVLSPNIWLHAEMPAMKSFVTCTVKLPLSIPAVLYIYMSIWSQCSVLQTKADFSVRCILRMNPSTHVVWHLPLGQSVQHQWPVSFFPLWHTGHTI